MISFPASYFLRERVNDCRWLGDTGRVLQTDEATLSVWRTMGNPLYVIGYRQDMNIGNFDVGFNIDDCLDLRGFINNSDPFIFHYGLNPVETVWREGIGAS